MNTKIPPHRDQKTDSIIAAAPMKTQVDSQTIDAESITHIESHDKPKPKLNVNSDNHAHQKSLMWRFWKLCKFWQPILGASAAIVSLLMALAQML